jgi:two-component system, OmpR family, sensor histidine kinase CpxA
LPFYRVDQSRSLYTGGFGIGLSIAARAVHLHSGSITARNRQEGGLAVTICLPLAAELHDE